MKAWEKLWRGVKLVYPRYSYNAKAMFRQAAAAADVKEHLLYSVASRPFAGRFAYEGSPDISRSFATYSSYQQTGYIGRVRDVTFIEPLFGFVVMNGGQYFRESVPYCDDSSMPPPFVLDNRGYQNRTCFKEAISIRYGWDNYWHFYNDALGTLAFLYSKGVPTDIPVVVPEGALQYSYVREVLKTHKFFKSIHFVFQKPDQWIECENIWFGKVLPNTRENLLNVVPLIDCGNPSGALQGRKLYVSRRGCATRNLANVRSIEAIAERHGFRVLDTVRLDVAAQKAAFRSAEVVVGVHGAGLSNLLFACDSHPKVLEIFPSSLVPPHYYWLSRELGYEYRAMLGSTLASDGTFYLDEAAFSAELERL